MRDRLAILGAAVAGAGAIGLCCGLPILLPLGLAGAIAGWSVQSWALIGAGLVLAAIGWARWSRGRKRDQACARETTPLPLDSSPDGSATNTTVDVTTKGNNP